MMEGILRMSVTGAVVILVVLLLRLCLRRLPKIFSYALWAIVLFRLLCPVSVSLPISVFNLLTVRQAKVADTDQLSPRENPGNKQPVFLEQGKQAANGEDFSEQSQSKNQIVRKIPKGKVAGSWQSICTVLWLVGVFGMLAYAAFDMMRLHKRIRSASLDGDNIYLLDGVTSPFVMGIVRPRIYLPYGLSEREREYVLLHEKTHIRRGDPLFRVIAYLALALHWFNPLVWIAFFVSGRDMEMSCDERVLRMLGSNIKREYSNSLLAMAQGKRLATNISLAFGEGGTGKRIKNVLNYKKATMQAAAIGVMVVALALTALGTNPVERALAGEQTDEASGLDDGNAKETVQGTGENEDAENDIRTLKKTDGFAEDVDEPSGGDVVKAAVSAEVSVRSISRSARCIDNYVAPDEEWEDTYGDTLAFAEECTYFINYNRWEMNPEEVSFGEFAGVIEKGDISLDKPCILQLGSDGLIYSIRLLKGYYLNGVSYATLPYEEPMPQHAKKLEQVRTETMDIATVPGEETIEIYTSYKDARNCAGAVFFDKDGNILHTFSVEDEGMCLSNLYIGRVDGAGEPFLLEVHLENRGTYGEYTYYVYTLGGKRGTFLQSEGSRIEWDEDSPLVYDADQMAVFFHMLGHYLDDSHLLVGMERKEDGTLGIRTDADCDEDLLTYANFAPSCFPDPYEGQDVR